MLGKPADGVDVPTHSIMGICNELLTNSVLDAPFVVMPKFAHIMLGSSSELLLGSSDALQASIREAESVRDAAAFVVDAVRDKMAMAIMIDAEDVDVSRPLHSFGGKRNLDNERKGKKRS